MEMNVSDIIIAGNPRRNFGDLSELIESIRANGIIQPLIVTKDNELIAGERRLRAAKELGMKTVPVIVQDYTDDQKREVKLIENMQRMDLNPIEEAAYFSDYLTATRKSADYLAKRIGKKADYIHRRMALNKLDDKVKAALAKGDIKLGHAVMISKFEKQKHEPILKRILKEDISVDRLDGALADQKDYFILRYAGFDSGCCAECQHNCSVQRTLEDLGRSMEGKCINPSCFMKKQKEHADSIRDHFRTLGVRFLKEDEYPHRMESIWNYDSDKRDRAKYDKLMADHPGKFAVRISRSNSGGRVNISLYTTYKEPVSKCNKDGSKLEGTDDNSAQLRLKNRMLERKRQLLSDVSQTKLKPNAKEIKALSLYMLLSKSDYHDKYRSEICATVNKNNMFEADDKTLENALATFAKGILRDMRCDFGTLRKAADALGFDIEKDFKMDTEFLDMYTKDQLTELAMEFDIDVSACKKKCELVDTILKSWKPGHVPKQFLEIGSGMEAGKFYTQDDEIENEDEEEESDEDE